MLVIYHFVGLLVSILVSAQAQMFSSGKMRSSLDQGNSSWVENDDGGNGDISSSYYLADLSSLSLLEHSEGSNASVMSGQWVWNQFRWDWWVILQAIAATIGIIGNSLVILLLFQRRKNSKSTDILIGALGTADMFTSIFMIPRPSAGHVPLTVLGQVYCKIVFNELFWWMSIDASIMTLTFISVERYIAILYPFRCKELLSRKKILAVVGLAWFIGFMMNIMYAFTAILDPSSNSCTVKYPWKALQAIMGMFTFTFEFLLPCLITLSMQVLTARSLHRQSRLYLGADKRLDQSNPSVRHLIAKRRVVQMLFTVVIIFIISWGPAEILFLAFNFRIIPETYLYYSPLYFAVNVLAFCNSCANPIIYTVRYPEFRKALKDIFMHSKRNTTPLFDERESKSQPPPTSGTNVA